MNVLKWAMTTHNSNDINLELLKRSSSNTLKDIIETHNSFIDRYLLHRFLLELIESQVVKTEV